MTPDSDDPRRPGEPAPIWDGVEAAMRLLREALPNYGDRITEALWDYAEIGRRHDHGEMCQHCSDTSLAALTAPFPRSGLNADLLKLLGGSG